MALDTFAGNVGIVLRAHEFHNGGGTGMFEAYVEYGGYKVSMELKI